jgi:anaerobic nitric oxide reductase flavorubredoxin
MLPVEIKPDIYWIGINDYTTRLFEGLWPISQEGVAYNSYLVKDEKNAIIDLATEASADEILAQIGEVTDPASLDYIILNHMEPDHTGVLPLMLNYASHATILATIRASNMLEAFYGITDRIHIVEDGETLSLGKHTLQFISTPNVHWPETMMTYEPGERILFSCDGFGGYGALHGGIFDDDYADLDFYRQEALRYYANIVATFSRPVLHAIEKLASVPVDIIAPSHGLVWRKDPAEILGLYRKWAEYNSSGGEAGVTLLYGSMYGNTERVMNAVAQGITREGVDVSIFNVTKTHASYILPYLWTQRGVMVGAPTYEGTLFPPMANMLGIAGVKHIRNKQVARFGSYGWKGGGAERHFEELIAPLKWELTEVFEFNGGPTRQELHEGIEFGARFARRVKAGG